MWEVSKQRVGSQREREGDILGAQTIVPVKCVTESKKVLAAPFLSSTWEEPWTITRAEPPRRGRIVGRGIVIP